MNFTIKKVEWDTSFFGFKIGKVNLHPGFIFDETTLIRKSKDYKLVYVFSEEPLILKDVNGQIKQVDTKVLFEKHICKIGSFSNLDLFDSRIHSYTELLTLAYISGRYSRFKFDKKFPSRLFNALYKRWLDKNIENSNDLVIVNCLASKIRGFVTVENFNLTSSKIGLIAVDPSYQKKGIGSDLLIKAEACVINSGLKRIEVATQQRNQEAISFYLKNGYLLKEKTYIYHYWNI